MVGGLQLTESFFSKFHSQDSADNVRRNNLRQNLTNEFFRLEAGLNLIGLKGIRRVVADLLCNRGAPNLKSFYQSNTEYVKIQIKLKISKLKKKKR